MALNDAVLQVELTQVPESTLPARLTVHRDDTVTFNGKFGTANTRISRTDSRDLRSLTDLLGLKVALKQYGNPEETAAIIAEVSIRYHGAQKDVIFCWDYRPRDAAKLAEGQRVKLLVKRFADIAKSQNWDHASAASYAQTLCSYLNSPQPAPR